MSNSRMMIALVFVFLLSGRWANSESQPMLREPKQDFAPLIESLAAFHAAVLGDSVKIDRCSVLQATGDNRIVSRLTPATLARLTGPRDCAANPGAQHPNWRGLVSIHSYGDSAVAQMEVKDGHYVHLATYRAIKTRGDSRPTFVSVLLHDFGFSGSAPPSPPKPRPPT